MATGCASPWSTENLQTQSNGGRRVRLSQPDVPTEGQKDTAV